MYWPRPGSNGAHNQRTNAGPTLPLHEQIITDQDRIVAMTFQAEPTNGVTSLTLQQQIATSTAPAAGQHD